MWPNSQIAAAADDDGARSLNSDFVGRERRLLAFRFARSSALFFVDWRALLLLALLRGGECVCVCVRDSKFLFTFFFVFLLVGFGLASVSLRGDAPPSELSMLHVLIVCIDLTCKFSHVALHRLHVKIHQK